MTKRLTEEYRTVFQIESFVERVLTLIMAAGSDPVMAYNRFMSQTPLLQCTEERVIPRELNFVCYYLGIGRPTESDMPF